MTEHEVDDVVDDVPFARPVDRTMAWGEGLIYAGVGLLLFVSAIAALVTVGYNLVDRADRGTLDTVAAALDGLLLVFILVELLGAVRATITERRLIAEPFLVVGIIASIKEIVVASLALADASGDKVEDGVMKIGVLGLVVLLLAVSSYLIRRKEREPVER
jgi:uncharacterized membrane protein (DUF373 family)